MDVIRFELLGDDGQWHEIPGITSAELHMEPPPADEEPPDDDAWRRYDGLDSLKFMYESVVRTTLAEEDPSPRVIDQDGNPVRPRSDRPAWQSPYGPPPRRHG